MAAATQDERINFFFGRDVAEVVKKDDATTQYMILQNDALHSQLEQARKAAARISKERDAASADLDSAERSKVCLRGVLHNEVEKNKARSDIITDAETSMKNKDASDRRHYRLTYSQDAMCVAVLSVGLAANMLLGRSRYASSAAMAYAILSAFYNMIKTNIRASYYVFEEYQRRSRCNADTLRKSERGSEYLHNIIDEL